METLLQLLHELIDHAVPQGNKRGELHALADELAAGAVEGALAKVTAGAKAASTPAVPGGPAQS